LAAIVIVGIALPLGAQSDQSTARSTHVVITQAPKSTEARSGWPTDCAAVPSVCGYPDATNTGIQPGQILIAVPGQETSGPGWTYSAEYQEVEVTSPGAVLCDLSITGNLNIEAANVTIDNVAIINSGNGWGIGLMHSVDATIEHSQVYSPLGADRLQVAIKDVYGDATGTNIRTTNIWDADTGIQLSQGRVANNYIHNMEADPGDHVNGIVSDAGVAAGLIIAHNTVFTPLGQTDAIGLFEDFGPQMDVTITHNLLSGGGYTIYGGANSGGATPSNIVITGNRLATTYFPDGGFYGPAAAVDTGVNGDVWSGNIWDSTGGTVCP
jgi:hypothetical protein